MKCLPARALYVLLAISLACVIPAQSSRFYTRPVLQSGLRTPAGASDRGIALTGDEFYMVFASDRAGGAGQFDLYESRRTSLNQSWSAPVALQRLNSATDDTDPGLRPDGLELYFASDRIGGLGKQDIYRCQRATPTATWSTPQLLAAPINRQGDFNSGPALTQDGLRMYFSSNGDIFSVVRSSIASTVWTNKVAFFPANTLANECAPVPDANGNILRFSSDRAGGQGGLDIYQTFFNSSSQQWTPPALLTDLNSANDDELDAVGQATGRANMTIDAAPSAIYEACQDSPGVRVPGCITVFPYPRLCSAWPVQICWTRAWFVKLGSSIVIMVYDWNINRTIVIAAVTAPPETGGIPLTPFSGLFRLRPPLLVTLSALRVGGVAMFPIQVPNNLALVGLRLNLQALSLGSASGILSELADFTITR